MAAAPETFSVNRNAKQGLHKLTEIFSGLEDSPPMVKLLGTKDDVKKFLRRSTVRVSKVDGYMYIDPWDGSIVANWSYLAEGELRDLYLDVIHELVHVKQWLLGKDLYDRRYAYTERPTESEAYAVVVGEAKRIGMTGKEILEYLEVPWISNKELKLLAKTLGIET